MRETANCFKSISNRVLLALLTSSLVLLKDASNLLLNEHYNIVIPRYSALIALSLL